MEKSSNKKILVVDDDDNLRTVLVDKLNQSGFDAVGASDGEGGLAKAIEIKPDVILLDVIMPKVGGWEMLTKLRKDPWGETAKVVMLTVLENYDNVALGVEKNISGYIVKTNRSLDEIVKQVSDILQGKNISTDPKTS
jgi:DNA-binding response OmpR family regulator